MGILVEARNVTKKYGKFCAIKEACVTINEGEIYGFVGKNGAGKTTFLKMLTGLHSYDSGSINMLGQDCNEKPDVFRNVGALIENPGLFDKMSAFANIKQKCICMGINDDKHIYELLELVGLLNVAKKKVKGFSLGMRQRLGIALALVGYPKLLVLDEPINGLDPSGIVDIRNLLLRLNKERNITIIISSHVLGELSKIATTYAFVEKGIIKPGIKMEDSTMVSITVSDSKKAVEILDNMGICNYKVKDEKSIEVYEECENAKVVKELVMADVDLMSIYTYQTSLEDYYFGFAGGGDTCIG